MDGKDLKNVFRLLALEHVISVLLATECEMADNPLAAAEKLKENFISTARQQTIPGADAAVSDLYSSEFEEALDRLLSATIALVRRNRQQS